MKQPSYPVSLKSIRSLKNLDGKGKHRKLGADLKKMKSLKENKKQKSKNKKQQLEANMQNQDDKFEKSESLKSDDVEMEDF